MNIVNAIGWITFIGAAFFLGLLIKTAIITGDWIFGICGVASGIIAVFTIRHWKPKEEKKCRICGIPINRGDICADEQCVKFKKRLVSFGEWDRKYGEKETGE